MDANKLTIEQLEQQLADCQAENQRLLEVIDSAAGDPMQLEKFLLQNFENQLSGEVVMSGRVTAFLGALINAFFKSQHGVQSVNLNCTYEDEIYNIAIIKAKGTP